MTKILTPAVHFYSDIKNTTLFTQERIEQNYFTPNRCKNDNISEFATKQCKVYLTTTMSKIGTPHNYRGNNYVINYFFLLFLK